MQPRRQSGIEHELAASRILFCGVQQMFRNHHVKDILSVAAVAGFGFVLLGLTFLCDFLFQSLVNSVLRLFTPFDSHMDWDWFPTARHAMFMVIVCLISRPILRSKLGMLYKAIYMTVPVAVILATIGIFLYRWPPVPYLVGGLFTAGVMLYLHRTKQPWLYYFSVIMVALCLMVFTVLGGEI
jgi:hypothetical protein